jgi:hypothetical protein
MCPQYQDVYTDIKPILISKSTSKSQLGENMAKILPLVGLRSRKNVKMAMKI